MNRITIGYACALVFQLIHMGGTAQFFDVKLGGGAGINLNPEYAYNSYFTEDQNGNVSRREEAVGIGLMGGLHSGVELGFELKDFLALTAGFDLTFGSAMIEEVDEWAPDEYSVARYHYTAEITSRVMRGQLGFRLQVPGDKTIRPYIGFGACSMLPSKVTVVNESTDSYSNSQDPSFDYAYIDMEEREFENRLTIGAYGVLGANWQVSDLLGIFVESRISALNWNPKRAEVVRAEEDGDDVLGDYTTEERVTIYQESGTISQDHDDSQPYVAAQETININAAIFKIGVSLRF